MECSDNSTTGDASVDLEWQVDSEWIKLSAMTKSKRGKKTLSAISKENRAQYKDFINSLKLSVKENPHCKPKVLYDMEIKKSKEQWRSSSKFQGNEDEIDLPSFDTVRMAMYNTRNAMFSMKPVGDEESSSRPSRSGDSTKSAGKRKSSPAASADLEGLVSTRLVAHDYCS